MLYVTTLYHSQPHASQIKTFKSHDGRHKRSCCGFLIIQVHPANQPTSEPTQNQQTNKQTNKQTKNNRPTSQRYKQPKPTNQITKLIKNGNRNIGERNKLPEQTDIQTYDNQTKNNGNKHPNKQTFKQKSNNI